MDAHVSREATAREYAEQRTALEWPYFCLQGVCVCVTPTPAAPAQAYFLKADGSLDLAVGGGAAGAVGGPIFLGPSMNRFFWVLWHALALVF